MNTSYKIKISEGQKSVTCEVAVEKEDKEEAINEVKEIYEDISKYCKDKTIEKQL